MDIKPQGLPPAANHGLSDRQVEVIMLVGKGLTSKEIGRHLVISPSTVDNHVKAAVDRLGARNRFDAFQRLSLSNQDTGTLLCDNVRNATDRRLSVFRLPPLGGRPNRLSTKARLFHIAQIAAFSLIGVSAAILTIAGVVHVLSN